MIDFDMNFQDTYKTPSEDLLSNGEQWFFLETEKDILKNRREELGMTQQQVQMLHTFKFANIRDWKTESAT